MSMPSARERTVVAKLAQPTRHFCLGPEARREPSHHESHVPKVGHP